MGARQDEVRGGDYRFGEHDGDGGSRGGFPRGAKRDGVLDQICDITVPVLAGVGAVAVIIAPAGQNWQVPPLHVRYVLLSSLLALEDRGREGGREGGRKEGRNEGREGGREGGRKEE